MGKVYRQDRKSVQRIKAKDIVPGDIVEIAGELSLSFFFFICYITECSHFQKAENYIENISVYQF
jgi:hypothetical protein